MSHICSYGRFTPKAYVAMLHANMVELGLGRTLFCCTRKQGSSDVISDIGLSLLFTSRKSEKVYVGISVRSNINEAN
jgi:hypothetical protein